MAQAPNDFEEGLLDEVLKEGRRLPTDGLSLGAHGSREARQRQRPQISKRVAASAYRARSSASMVATWVVGRLQTKFRQT